MDSKITPSSGTRKWVLIGLQLHCTHEWTISSLCVCVCVCLGYVHAIQHCVLHLYFRQDNESCLGVCCDLPRHALCSKVTYINTYIHKRIHTYIHTCIGWCRVGVVRVGCGIIRGGSWGVWMLTGTINHGTVWFTLPKTAWGGREFGIYWLGIIRVAIRYDVFGTKATCWRVSTRGDAGIWGCEGILCHIELFCSLVFHSLLLVTQCWISFMWWILEFYIAPHLTYKWKENPTVQC